MISENPEIFRAWQLYTECREQQLFYMETVKGSGRDQKVVKHVVPFTQGYHTLPEEGGMLDQPYRLMTFFDIFFNTDRKVTYKNLKK